MSGPIAELFARLALDSKPFVKGLDDSERAMLRHGQKLEDQGKRASDIGNKMSLGLTLPLVAIGGAALKAAADWDKTFTQMQTLAGVSAQEVEGLKSSVMDLSGETTRSPQELAEALYFVRSAGISGSAALDVVESSAKAAAIGLGSTVDVADAVTSAMNAYGQENLSAAEATDALVSAVRIAKVEASEIAPQLGRILPVAAELGIEFNEVAASLGYLTQKSGQADSSATQLSGAIGKLLRPSKQAGEAIAELYGIDLADLETFIRGKLAADGFQATLVDLRTRADEAGIPLASLFDDTEALNGVLGLTGQNAEGAAAAIDEAAAAAGTTESAFATFAESAGFKNAKAFADFQAALIDVGDTLVPIATEIATAVSSMLGVFTDLDPAAQKIVISFGALLAVSGPLLRVGGAVTTTWGKITQQMSTMGEKSSAAAQGLSKIGTVMQGAAGAVGIATAAFALYEIGMAKARQSGSDFAKRVEDSMQSEVRSFEGFATANASIVDKQRALLADAEGMDNNPWDRMVNADDIDALAQASNEMGELVEVNNRATLQMRNLADEYDISLDAAAAFIQEQMALGIVFETNEQAMEAYSAEVNNVTGVTTEQVDAADQLTSQLGMMKDTIDELIGQNIGYVDSLIALEDGYAAMGEQVLENGVSLALNEEAGRKNLSMINDQVGAVIDSANAYADQTGDIAGAAGQLAAHRDRLVEDLVQMGFNREGVEAYIAQLGLTPDNINTLVTADVSGAMIAIDAVQQNINELQAQWNAWNSGQIAAAAALGIPAGQPIPVGAGEQGMVIPMAAGGWRGGTVNQPTYLVGEGGKGFKEYVIPTDPAFRERAKSLYAQLGRDLGSSYDSALEVAGTTGRTSSQSMRRPVQVHTRLVIDGREFGRAITPALRILNQE